MLDISIFVKKKKSVWHYFIPCYYYWPTQISRTNSCYKTIWIIFMFYQQELSKEFSITLKAIGSMEIAVWLEIFLYSLVKKSLRYLFNVSQQQIYNT